MREISGFGLIYSADFKNNWGWIKTTQTLN